MKIFANYLPQFHQIPENDEFWGVGFTDWVSCREAKQQFIGHKQPRVPLNNNYYSLDNYESIKWQVDLAKKYGVSGFGMYHYWFHEGLNLLTKPAEILLKNQDLDIEFFFIWDNKSWKRTWSALTGGASWTTETNRETKILAELIYGDEKEWKSHFDFLLPYFKDKRYVKFDGKVIFAIFHTYKEFDKLKKMEAYWNKLAIENDLKGIEFISRTDYKQRQFDSSFIYTPFAPITVYDYVVQKLKRILFKEKVKTYSYDVLWKRIIKRSKKVKRRTILSGFVDFDDTPRRGNNGNVVIGATPGKFYNYVKQLLEIAKGYEFDFILITAWNEWGEGAYLEPDENEEFAYLEALKKAINDVNKG